jgi:hypothetical protein
LAIGLKSWLKKRQDSFIYISAQRSTTDNAYEVIYPNGVKVNYEGGDLTVLPPADPALLMFSLGSSHQYYLYRGDCDMRKGRVGGPI